MIRRIVAVALTLSLAACATVPTYYQPAAAPAGVGYSEMRIEAGRYRITFQGGPGAPPEQVSDYALLRAADLALADGYDWFQVTDRYLRRTGQGNGPRIGLGVGGADFGRRSSVGVGLGTSFNLGPGPAVVATVEVVMGKGAKPAAPEAYDARDLRRTLGVRT